MKKLIIILAIMMLSSGYSVGQQYSMYDEEEEIKAFTDGFFTQSNVEIRENSEWGTMPLLPRTHGYHYDYDAEEAPLGSGCLLLLGMGVGYAVAKRRNKKNNN